MYVNTKGHGKVHLPGEQEAERDLLVLQRWLPTVHVEVEELSGRKSLLPISDLVIEDGSTIEPNTRPLFTRLKQIRFA